MQISTKVHWWSDTGLDEFVFESNQLSQFGVFFKAMSQS